MEMRWYQEKAVDTFWSEAKKHPKDDLLLVLPTGAGKTIVMAYIIKGAIDYGMQVLVLARTKELIEQNLDKFVTCFPEMQSMAGAYCAGLNSREYDKPIVFASVQSVFNKGELFGERKLVIVDECHQIPQNENSQYQQLIEKLREACPSSKLLGLTASPYRLDGGVIFGEGQQFARVAYSVPLRVLINEGYITKPRTLDVTKINLDNIKKTAGDFNRAEVESRFLSNSLGPEIVDAANDKGCKSVLVFASGVAHAEQLAREIISCGEHAEVITGETMPLMRSSIIESFTKRKIRFLINCECLTTGFDAPCIDLIAVCRATYSPGLFLQMVGRGFRNYPNKDICWVMDYGENIARHGPIDSDEYGMDTIKVGSGSGEAPKRVCPRCLEINHAAARECIRCFKEFPRKEITFVAARDFILSEPEWLDVVSTTYTRHAGKNGKTDSVRVTYKCSDDRQVMGVRYVSEWICIEHVGFARQQAHAWFARVSNQQFPHSVDELLEIVHELGVAEPKRISVKKEGKYDRIVDRELGEKPEKSFLTLDDDCPF